MPNKFTIEVRNALYERIGVIEQYNRFEAIVRHCDVGTWSLTVDATVSDANLLTEGGGIIVWSEGITEPLISGPVKSITRSWNINNPGGLITFVGKSDECWLYERIIYPNPTLPIENQNRDRDQGSINAGAALAYFTAFNLGDAALTDRVHPYIQVDNDNSGPAINVSARFDVLGEYLQKIAFTSGYAYRMFHDDDHVRFKIFKPEDRTGEIIFSPDLGNMSSYDYTVSAPTANAVIVAAQGEGKQRWLKRFSASDMAINYDDSVGQGISYTGSWIHDDNLTGNVYGGTRSYSDNFGETATLSFNGRRVALYAIKAPSGGPARIYLDGVQVAFISQGGSSAGAELIWDSGALTPGNHTVEVVSQVSPGQYFAIDYFAVYPDIPATSSGIEWASFNPERFADRRDIPIMNIDGIAYDPSTVGSEGGIDHATPAAMMQFDQAGYEALIEGAGMGKLSVTPIDTELVKFGRDYSLGDKVSISINGITFSDILREIRIADSLEDGAKISPLVGTDGATETPDLYKRVRELEMSLRKLEARL